MWGMHLFELSNRRREWGAVLRRDNFDLSDQFLPNLP